MRIAAVTTAVVQANFDYTFVRVHADDGTYGTGECFPAPALAPMAREFGRLLIGQDARHPAPLWKRMMTAVSGSGSAAGAGIAYNAISGIEAALWDLNGKRTGEPVARLLGGAYRQAVDVYADVHGGTELHSMTPLMQYRVPFWMSRSGATETGGSYWEEAEAEGASIEQAVERCREAVEKWGFRHVKLDLDVFATVREGASRGATASDIARMRSMALAVREAVGEDVEVAYDCHWRFDLGTALAVIDAVAPARPMWVEDPVPPEPETMARVTSQSTVPIATGENTYLVEGFDALMRAGGAHIVTPDVQKAGGLAETVRIGELAARRFVSVAPHCIASPVGFVAAVHVCAALPNHLCLEFHGMDVPFWEDLIVGDTPVIDAGRARVPEAPGLGIELDLDVVRRYSPPGEPVFDEVPSP
jgi:L-alanine-DL-glutamate epimerase-like enolase superfamily enzyme